MNEEPQTELQRDTPHLRRGYGAMFKEVRTRRRLTQIVVANACGVTQAAVSRWEAEEDAPGEKIVAMLAYLYCVDMEQLGWKNWKPINLSELRPAGAKLGTVMSDEEYFRREAAKQEKLRVAEKAKADKILKRQAMAARAAAVEQARIAERAEKAARLAERLRFNTPYYRAKREAERLEREAEQLRLATLSDQERADLLFERHHENLMRGLKMLREPG